MASPTYTSTEIQALVAQMDDSMLRHAEWRGRNFSRFKELVAADCPVLAKDYDRLFEMNLSDGLGPTFKYMLKQLKAVEHGKVTRHNADVNIGQHMVDKYVKPKLDAAGEPPK